MNICHGGCFGCVGWLVGMSVVVVLELLGRVDAVAELFVAGIFGSDGSSYGVGISQMAGWDGLYSTPRSA